MRVRAQSPTGSLVLGLFPAGLAVQGFHRAEHGKLLETFDQQLKMDTREEFETSLENMRFLIESTAILVATEIVGPGITVRDLRR